MRLEFAPPHTQLWAPPMPRGSQVCATLLALATWLFAGKVAGDESVRLVYRAPASCPDERVFVDAVRARTTQARFVADSPGRGFFVSLAATGAGYAGTVEIRGGESDSGKRRFEATDCGELVAALALLTALTIDPHASTEESGLPPSLPSPSFSPPPPPPSPTVVPPASEPWVFSVGLGLAIESGVFPDAATAPELFGEVAKAGTGHWAPRFRAALLYSQSGVLSPTSPTAQYLWGAGRFEACLPRAFVATIELRPCGVTEVGALAAKATATTATVPMRATPLWLAAGVTGIARWSFPLKSSLVRPLSSLFFEAEGGVLFPVTRPRFEVTTPTIVVHTTPAVTATASLAVGVSFL